MLLQNAVSPRSKKATEEKISLFNILTCLLCSGKAKMAHICPNCSKFYCEGCIKDWMRQGNQECPHCKSIISQSTIVNCNKLSQDLSNALEALIQLQTPQESQCESHGIAQTYYCEQCATSICSDCIVLETRHRGHSIIKLSKMKMNFNQHILLHLSKIRKCVKEMEKNREDTVLEKNAQTELAKQKIDLLNIHVHKMRVEYELIVNSAIERYEGVLNGGRLVFLAGSKIYEECLNEIKQLSKVQLVDRSQEKTEEIARLVLEQDSQQIMSKEEILAVKERASINMISQKFAHKTFILANYTQYRQKREVIYSDIFSNGPLSWRLKIYPSGLDKKYEEPVLKKTSSHCGEEYVSIYIQLVSGAREAGRYQFTIGITSQSDESKVISQIYEADFDAIKCWGYDEFANISTLYQKGYVNTDDDSIKISVSVGPPSYYYSQLDQEAIITNKLRIINQNNLKIEELRIRKATLDSISEQRLKENPETVRPELPLELPAEEVSDIKTPRCRMTLACKNQSLEQSMNYKNFAIEMAAQEPIRGNEEFDHQSAQLRKIYRRLAQMGQKSNLLLF